MQTLILPSDIAQVEMPVDIEGFMRQCTAELNSDCVAVITQAVEAQDPSWVCSVVAFVQHEDTHKPQSPAEI